MPEICRFYGIVIRINFREHLPPHFHAEYGDEMAIIDIRTLAVFEGRLPPAPQKPKLLDRVRQQIRTRHYLHESVLQKAVREAVLRTGIAKSASCHTRHSFATHLLGGRLRYPNDSRTIGPQ